jgi:Uma2 family endonuclease
MATDLRKPDYQKRSRPQPKAEPTWEIARLFPAQGDWTEEEYFALASNHFVEFVDGYLEFLPMPTIFHQLLLQYLFKKLDAFVSGNGLGLVVVSGYKVRLRSGKYREPDVLFIKEEHRAGIKKQYCEKVDLVIEVVSDKNRLHDIETKRIEYAKAGIPEYLIIDPKKATITALVLRARSKSYIELGTFRKGQRAASKILRGFTVDVTEALSQKP